MDKFVVSVGAGKNQLPLINRLVERNYKVIGFDKNINAPGRNLCYMFNNISTWDWQQAIDWLDSIKLPYKSIMCFSCGKALVTQQKLINYYNLGCKLDQKYISLMEDKSIMRNILNKFGLSTLKEFNSVNEIYLMDSNIRYIIKDKAGISSNNIFFIDIKDNKLDLIKQFVNKQYVIQEYIDGKEYRIICLVKDCKVRFFAIMEKQNLKGTFFTSRLIPQKEYSNEYINLVEKIVDRFKISDSVMKIDLINDNKRIEILEIDFGIGGDYFETFICPLCYNYNFIDNYINLMLGLEIDYNISLLNELCFDYIYSVNKDKVMLVDYDKIYNVVNKYFSEYKVIEKKKQGSKVAYPRSNIDAAFGIIHNKKGLSNYEINVLFNQILCE